MFTIDFVLYVWIVDMGPALSHSELRSVQFQGDSSSVTASSVDVPKARVMDSKEDPKKINAILPQ